MPKENESISLTQLENGMIVPTVEGRLFCSRRDPVKESEKWFKENEISIRRAEKVLILGLGAGFHLFQFTAQDEIFVLETRPELIEIFKQRSHPWTPKIHFLKPGEELDATVFEFRPAWLGSESSYIAWSRFYRQADGKSLQMGAERKNLWMLSEALQGFSGPDNMELSAKEISQLFPIENQSQEAKIWRTLRELIQ